MPNLTHWYSIPGEKRAVSRRPPHMEVCPDGSGRYSIIKAATNPKATPAIVATANRHPSEPFPIRNPAAPAQAPASGHTIHLNQFGGPGDIPSITMGSIVISYLLYSPGSVRIIGDNNLTVNLPSELITASAPGTATVGMTCSMRSSAIICLASSF